MQADQRKILQQYQQAAEQRQRLAEVKQRLRDLNAIFEYAPRSEQRIDGNRRAS